MEIEIIHEDENILAINKPAGLVVHHGVGVQESLVDWILQNYPEMKDVGEPLIGEGGETILRPGIVHRLDKETSGVLLLAKNETAFKTLKKHFQKGKIGKEYHAFVHNKPRKIRGTVDLAIGKSRSDFRKRSVLASSRGVRREARTEYVLVSRCDEDTSFMKFFPLTGRTHQIRVHAQSLQTPVVGDSLYAPKKDYKLGFSRLALHAQRLTIHTHQQEEQTDIIAPYPPDFEMALKKCSE